MRSLPGRVDSDGIVYKMRDNGVSNLGFAILAAMCLSNIKQLSMATIMYSSDWDDHWPQRHHTVFAAGKVIELLVVIAIIAILAAILFPVFAKAREKVIYN